MRRYDNEAYIKVLSSFYTDVYDQCYFRKSIYGRIITFKTILAPKYDTSTNRTNIVRYEYCSLKVLFLEIIFFLQKCTNICSVISSSITF